MLVTLDLGGLADNFSKHFAIFSMLTSIVLQILLFVFQCLNQSCELHILYYENY
jgi:hypothetical protein